MHHTNYYHTYPGYVPPEAARQVETLLPPISQRERKAALRQGRRSAQIRGSRRTALLIFAVFLLLIGGTAAAGLAMNYASIPVFQLRPFPPFVMPDSGYEEEQDPYSEEYIPPTTIERAPTAQGVALTLHPAAGAALTLQEIYRKNIPSVVSVLTTSLLGGSSGTGVVLNADGYIITNHHVIQGGSAVDVVLYDGRRYSAKLVGSDQTNDLAVLKIEGSGLTGAEFGDSEALQVGDIALAIGNPLGEELRGTMTDGIISAIDRNVRSDGNAMTLIQTTAALNSGNSGGALINAYGQVVGITNMKMMSDYNTIEGLGFAIPSATTKAVTEELIAAGHVAGRPVLGFSGYSLTKAAAEEQNLVSGVYASVVDPKSDAYKKGLRPGDVVTECNGQAVSSVEDINAIKNGFHAGDSLKLKVYRNGKYLDLEIRLIEKYELDK
jgi:serine protease Do